MSQSMHVVGFWPPDEKWKKHRAVWDACKSAGVAPPQETDEFFNWIPPDAAGVEVAIQETPCCKRYRGEMTDGFEIDVTQLPKDVTVVRFFTAY